MNILETCDISPTVCFKYDDIYFPYIVLWYSPKAHKWYYQTYPTRDMADTFYDMLFSRGKNAVMFIWDTNLLTYALAK